MRLILAFGFLACSVTAVLGQGPNSDHFPQPPNKKGLQVQMIDDAIALGVHHGALNVDLTQLLDLSDQPNGPTWTVNGKKYTFAVGQVAAIDNQVKPLSDHNIVVTLILLTYGSQDPKRNQLMLHPKYAPTEKHAGPIAMFNTTTPESSDALQACIEFLADRYSSEKGHGRVWGYISGNEVNSHWFWANMGNVTPDEVITEYEKATRLIHRAVRKSSKEARVYLSMDHFWKDRYAAGAATQCMGGKEFLDRFAAKAKENGDFDWHLAHHPYPEPLTDPRFWLDHVHTAHNNEAHSITFRNLDVLMTFLNQDQLKFEGQPRRVILSEQGFHCDEKRPQGELEQAAAYALAYKVIDKIPGIDSFILHRHTDHAQEGGLNLGLWTNKPGEICTPDRKRKMYEVFEAAGTPNEEKAFSFALPVIGSASWDVAIKQLMNP